MPERWPRASPMRHRNPHQAGSAAIAGSDRPERNEEHGCREVIAAFVARFELRERLAAVADELAFLDADTDVPETITLGLLGDLDAALNDVVGKWRA